MAMNYTNSPAAQMLATHCAVCGRPLVDAVSVDTGVGPECRKRHGYNVEVDEETRAEANKLVRRIALEQTGISVLEAAGRLKELGLAELAKTIIDRKTKISIEEVVEENGAVNYRLRCPYNAMLVSTLQSIPGSRWSHEDKVWTIPRTGPARKRLWGGLLWAFTGQTGIGPKGPFVLGASE